MSAQESLLVTKEVESMLKKGTIQKTSLKKYQFLSNLFLVGKKDRGNRPVINLKNLNALIPYLHFKMTGVHLLNDMLKEKDYMCKIHLKDAYFCVHCIKNIRSTSGFLGRSIIWISLYMFWPGVISTNFYKATETPNSNSTSINIRIIAYLEDMLLMCQTIQGLNKARDKIDFSFKATGFQNRSEKISTICNPETRIFGPANRLSQHDSNSPNGKSKKLNSGMQELDGK